MKFRIAKKIALADKGAWVWPPDVRDRARHIYLRHEDRQRLGRLEAAGDHTAAELLRQVMHKRFASPTKLLPEHRVARDENLAFVRRFRRWQRRQWRSERRRHR